MDAIMLCEGEGEKKNYKHQSKRKESKTEEHKKKKSNHLAWVGDSWKTENLPNSSFFHPFMALQ